MAKSEHPTEESIEQALLYAMGVMTPAEAGAVEAHLAGCPACEQTLREFNPVIAELSHLAPQAAPPERLRSRLLSRISAERKAPAGPQVWKGWNPARTSADLVTVRRDDQSWEDTGFDGIQVRRLFVDPTRDSVTMLVKMAPGTSYPRHRHAAAEECFVLEGEVHVGDRIALRAGDYQRAEGGSVHDLQWTETGCLLLITSSRNDRLLD
jgi:anti-sigma factor ChrR (cupin superfamily)